MHFILDSIEPENNPVLATLCVLDQFLEATEEKMNTRQEVIIEQSKKQQEDSAMNSSEGEEVEPPKVLILINSR